MTLLVLSTVLALAFIALGAARIALVPLATAPQLGLFNQQLRVIGVLEIIFAVLVFLGIWIGWLGWVGSLMLTVIAAGAILAHSRIGDAPVTYVAPSVLGILSFLVFLIHMY